MPDTSQTAAVPVGERRVDTAHGSIFVREAPGDGPAVVLMHGFPDDQRIYARLLPLLSPRRALHTANWHSSLRFPSRGHRPA
jgi:pimeloyl-ACP methyl ester carboxylesterase